MRLETAKASGDAKPTLQTLTAFYRLAVVMGQGTLGKKSVRWSWAGGRGGVEEGHWIWGWGEIIDRESERLISRVQ